ncbi:MAG: hypothetical protein ACTSQI_03910 [Candidatus Helarchaeota archaeon]
MEVQSDRIVQEAISPLIPKAIASDMMRLSVRYFTEAQHQFSGLGHGCGKTVNIKGPLYDLGNLNLNSRSSLLPKSPI